MQLLHFILAAYGMTFILVYGKIFEDLRPKKDYSKNRERKTEIRVFDNINASKVIVTNKKLYVNKLEGFIGWTLRKDEYVDGKLRV